MSMRTRTICHVAVVANLTVRRIQSRRGSRMTNNVRRIAVRLLAMSVLAAAPYVLSQSNNASVDGVVHDPKGAVVAGAQVVLTSQDTKQSSTFVSDNNGL